MLTYTQFALIVILILKKKEDQTQKTVNAPSVSILFAVSIVQMYKMCKIQKYPKVLQNQHRMLMVALIGSAADSSNKLNANKGNLRISFNGSATVATAAQTLKFASSKDSYLACLTLILCI